MLGAGPGQHGLARLVSVTTGSAVSRHEPFPFCVPLRGVVERVPSRTLSEGIPSLDKVSEHPADHQTEDEGHPIPGQLQRPWVAELKAQTPLATPTPLPLTVTGSRLPLCHLLHSRLSRLPAESMFLKTWVSRCVLTLTWRGEVSRCERKILST